uniref:EF-hand domain-containing protein n=1 Tax=Romanomermis culicivorax TaxID=13658 RepID=A0A915ITW8_ROMCU
MEILQKRLTEAMQKADPNAAALEPDKNELKKVFDEFDKDGDGFIQMEELRTVLQNMGQNLSDEDLEIMFQAADVNRDGGISFEGKFS